jgi:cellulose synthase/poly-beta-1,6-N-acetylglucosamine synthase-like glycosyltransferase
METGGADGPALSVIVPVRDGARFLPRSLAALRASTTGTWTWELVVVDDGSTDSSAEIAEGFADRVIRLPAVVRPAAARNAGAAAARARILVFVDADVSVHADALGRIHEFLSAHPEIDAVFGAYDTSPAAPGLVSQYRNLLHHYVHQREAGETVTFWAGLGAIRRTAFERAGQFDDRQHLVEDIELGYRLSGRGCRIVLRPEIQGTHLKRWTLASMVLADVWHRGVPWVRLLLERRQPVNRATLNIRVGEQILTGLAAVAVLLSLAALVTGQGRLMLLAGLAAGLTVAGDWRFSRWLVRSRGWWFALRAIPLRLMYYVMNVISAGLGLLQACAERKLPAALPAAPAVRRADKTPA